MRVNFSVVFCKICAGSWHLCEIFWNPFRTLETEAATQQVHARSRSFLEVADKAIFSFYWTRKVSRGLGIPSLKAQTQIYQRVAPTIMGAVTEMAPNNVEPDKGPAQFVFACLNLLARIITFHNFRLYFYNY